MTKGDHARRSRGELLAKFLETQKTFRNSKVYLEVCLEDQWPL